MCSCGKMNRKHRLSTAPAWVRVQAQMGHDEDWNKGPEWEVLEVPWSAGPRNTPGSSALFSIPHPQDRLNFS